MTGAPEDHRWHAVEANNLAWSLIESFTPGEDEEPMLRAAYAAAFHWSRAAGASPVNEARALLLLGRAHLTGGRADVGLYYGNRSFDLLAEIGRADFDLAYVHDLRARCLMGLGRAKDAAAEHELAYAVPVADDADRDILLADLAVPLQ
ncbi:hypothetical protein [Nocardioides sp. Kera G14]|uniref:hypothetical protein n=1 Tax=Nocardioides sp. Kera G14 TaxID=2884264 RepID=UPI001D0FEF49|nr:hypothetical protein [Nocardioides sp. Kera G14]UDY25063.1 hypothetical protein LH076_07165 [Nocardioides sp. Kera G14]